MREDAPSTQLLLWYDTHARELPWRIGPLESQQGVRQDPYRVWLSEVMLQQTTVAAVKDYYLRFTSLWPTVADLAAARDEQVMAEWAGLGYYARARNLLKCARTVVADYEGQFPTTKDELIKLPGIGPYTASAIAAIAFNRPETVVDGNVERVMARLHNVHSPLPSAKRELTELAVLATPKTRSGDYAQAVMDLGATVCTPRNPQCNKCPLAGCCNARTEGTAADLPKKTPKKPKPTRFGVAYVAQREDGAFLLEQRPDKGLLGGMLGWPGSDWAEQTPDHEAPTPGNWRTMPSIAKHTFTHFHLELTVKTTRLAMGQNPRSGFFISREDFDRSALPTVMRKAFDVAQGGEE